MEALLDTTLKKMEASVNIFCWDTLEVGGEYQPQLFNLEWVTRLAHIPFRVWDALQEIINNNVLPKNCKVRIRAFYVSAHIVFIFGNNPKALADIVLGKQRSIFGNTISSTRLMKPIESGLRRYYRGLEPII